MQNGHVSVGIVIMIVKVGTTAAALMVRVISETWSFSFPLWRQVLVVAQAAFEFAV